MADGGRIPIGLEQLEQSLNLELTANEHELQALEQTLDDHLNDVGGGNKPRNVTPSLQVFRYGAQGRVTESSNHSKRKLKRRKITTSVINTDEGKFFCSAAV